MTRNGHAFVEFAKTAKVHAVARNLSEERSRKLRGKVRAVSWLSHLAEADLVDLDPTVSKADILKALIKAALITMTDAEIEKALIKNSGL